MKPSELAATLRILADRLDEVQEDHLAVTSYFVSSHIPTDFMGAYPSDSVPIQTGPEEIGVELIFKIYR